MLFRAPDPGAPRGCHVAPFPRLYSRRYSKFRPSSGLWDPCALRGVFSEGPLRVSEEGFPMVLWGCLRRVFRGSEGNGWDKRVRRECRLEAFDAGNKLPVTQLVFVARGAFPRSTPCVCALRDLLPGRVFPDRTTRRQGLARPPPDWVGWAERVVTVPP